MSKSINYKKLLNNVFKKVCISILVVALSFTIGCGTSGSGTGSGTGGKLEPSQVFEQTKTAVGEVITYNKSNTEVALGTCFVYNSSGYIMTNYHVIEDSYKIKITLNDVDYWVEKILAYDKDIDLAVLKVNATGLPYIKVATRNIKVGEKCFALGSSRGLTLTFSQGSVTSVDREMDGVTYVQHDAAISNGNSGGPLLNEYGEVLGVNTMTIRDSQNLNFAIDVSEFSKLSFSTPLTPSQYYEKECDVFKIVKDATIKYGVYDSEDVEYEYDIYTTTNNGYYYNGTIYYDITNATLTFSLFMQSTSSGYACMTFLEIGTQISTSYGWQIVDTYYDYMEGTIYPSSFSSSTTSLYYTSTNVTSASTKATYNKLAVSSMKLMLIYADVGFENKGINATVADFGFVNF